MADEEFKWPSERVAQGGLFHPAKVTYSKETNDLLNLLMEESRLSMMLRKKINYHLRNGDPLPLPEPPKPPQPTEHDFTVTDILRRARCARRKNLETIKASGAYDQPKFRPVPNLREPCEVAKLRLQETMYGTKISTSNLNPKRKSKLTAPKLTSPADQINLLLDEIEERAEWLAEMDAMGEGKRYKDMIHSQVAEKLNKIRDLEKKTDEMVNLRHLNEMKKSLEQKST